MPSIFESFGRAHGPCYGGLGLGLSIARGIVEQHHGKIWVESDPARVPGSTFHVVLPQSVIAGNAAEPDGPFAK